MILRKCDQSVTQAREEKERYNKSTPSRKEKRARATSPYADHFNDAGEPSGHHLKGRVKNATLRRLCGVSREQEAKGQLPQLRPEDVWSEQQRVHKPDGEHSSNEAESMVVSDSDEDWSPLIRHDRNQSSSASVDAPISRPVRSILATPKSAMNAASSSWRSHGTSNNSPKVKVSDNFTGAEQSLFWPTKK